MKLFRSTLFILTILLLLGCRGDHSNKPPIHLNRNMDSQDKFKAYSTNTFFPDSSTMRQPVEGTIKINEDFGKGEYLTGKDANGNLIDNPPFLTSDLLKRGEDRYNIYCAVCHGSKGGGQGTITKYKFPIPPTNFHQDFLIEQPDGYIFEVITDGIRTMPSYKHQIPVADRWAIVSYVRKLQEETK